jgi:thioredoxin
MSTVNLNAKNFSETVKNNDIVVLDWWASWCGPCRAFAPIYEKASAEHSDIVFGKINTEEELDLSAAFGIQSIPTLMIFREEIILFSEAGMMSAKQLGELLGRVRSLDMQDVRRRIAEAAKAESSKKAVPQRTALNEA